MCTHFVRYGVFMCIKNAAFVSLCSFCVHAFASVCATAECVCAFISYTHCIYFIIKSKWQWSWKKREKSAPVPQKQTPPPRLSKTSCCMRRYKKRIYIFFHCICIFLFVFGCLQKTFVYTHLSRREAKPSARDLFLSI